MGATISSPYLYYIVKAIDIRIYGSPGFHDPGVEISGKERVLALRVISILFEHIRLSLLHFIITLIILYGNIFHITIICFLQDQDFFLVNIYK